MPIYRPSQLLALGLRPKKLSSQNFLIDQNVLKKITHTADIQKGDTVLEIGPGPGALTESLLNQGAHVIAVEKDRGLAKKLERLKPLGSLKVICDDALNYKPNDLPKNTKIVANLPYHITTPLIEKFIDRSDLFSSLTVMVQYEVGKKMCARANSPLYGLFTLLLNAYSHPQFCFKVSPRSFYPVPSVRSCVVHMPLHPFPFSFPPQEFFYLIRAAFGKKRKMLKSSLSSLHSSEKIKDALHKMGKKETARPQELSLKDFGNFFEELQK